jgi:dCMP deaminase
MIDTISYVRELKVVRSILSFSDDLHKQVAIMAWKNGSMVATGVNCFPKGIKVTLDRLEKPFKYKYMLHAEEKLILNAGRTGVELKGSTCVLTWVPCLNCARLLIDAEISTLIMVWEDIAKLKKYNLDDSLELLEESAIRVIRVDKDGVQISG